MSDFALCRANEDKHMKTSKTTKRQKTSRSKAVDCSQEVRPENSTVLGYANSQGYWPFLRFKEAKPMQKSSLMIFVCGSYDKAPPDIHLSVPFAAEGDEHMKSEELGWYRVRPCDKKVTGVVRRRGKWYWTYS